MDNELEGIIEDLKEKANSIKMDDEAMGKLLGEARKKLENNQILSALAKDIKLAMEMFTAWKDGDYEELSQNTVVLITAGLLYIVNPLKMLPKVLEKSILDDLVIGFYILKKIKEELRKYEKWKVEMDFSPGDPEKERNYIEL